MKVKNGTQSKPVQKKSEKVPAVEPRYRVNYYFAMVAAIAAFVLYANGIRHGYMLDDSAAITENNYVQMGISGIPKLLTVDFWHFTPVRLGYYRPLPLITYAIEFQFFGLSPHLSHFNNVLLFALTVFALFLFLSKLFSHFNPLFPLLVSLLFAAHPIHTEIVDNIKGRDELLSFFNTIAMLWCVIMHAERKKTGFLVAGLFFFYLALLSKESALMGILLVPLVLWFYDRKSLTELLRKSWPFVVVLFLFYLQKTLLFETKDVKVPVDMVNYPYTAEEVRYSSAFMMVLYFIKMLVVPYPLRYDYSYNQIPAVGWANLQALAGLLIFAGLAIYAFVEIRKRGWYGFALGFLCITLLPPLGFIMTRGGIFAERLLFFPSLGFCLILVLVLVKIIPNDLSKPLSFNFISWKKNVIVTLIVLLVFSGYAFVVVDRNGAWKDDLSLYGSDIRTGDRSAQNQLHYGALWLRAANEAKDSAVKAQYLATGMKAMRKAVQIYPRFADALFWIGYGYEIRARQHPTGPLIDSAIIFYNAALERAPRQFWASYHLGFMYEWTGRYPEASYYYNLAQAINPEFGPVIQKVREFKEQKGLDVRTNPFLKSAAPKVAF